MEAFAPISAFRQVTIRVCTRHATDTVDLTEEVEALVAETGIERGTLTIRSFRSATALLLTQPEPLLLSPLEVGAPVCLDVQHGEVTRSRSERILLVDLDGPRGHDISVLIVGGREDESGYSLRSRTRRTA